MEQIRVQEYEFEGVPTLPSLPSGVVLLDVTSDERLVGPLDSLALDHLLGHDGDIVWVDSHGHATTQHLSRIAPSQRFLERIRVARGFTAQQHYTLVDRVVEQTPPSTSLVVVPWVDALYRDGDLRRGELRAMLERVADRLVTFAERTGATVLCTRREADELTEPFEAAATERIECQQTRFGPRFVGEEFETLVYELPDGGVQTTLAFWARVVERRFWAMEERTQPVVRVA